MSHLHDATFIARCLGLPADDLINHPGTRRLAADLHAEDAEPFCEATGPMESDLHPDRVLRTPVTEAERLEDIRICQSGEASPEQLSLLRWLATKAVAGELDGWRKFNDEVNEVIRLCGKWGKR